MTVARRVSFPPEFVAGLRALISEIPPGRVIAYSDAAAAIGYGTGRHSAAALSAGLLGDCPWWRVIRADGTLVADLLPAARIRWEAEGTPLASRDRVNMDSARWRPAPDVLERVDRVIDDAAARLA